MFKSKETNAVCFSSLLQSDNRSSKACPRLLQILERNRIKYKFIESTKDIWPRDFMPIQVDDNRFIQFRYEPSYLEGYRYLQSDPKVVTKANGIDCQYSDINLDGGNLVNWCDRAIVTDRIFRENSEFTNKTQLISELEKLLGVEIIVIPQINSDLTGHADGLVRFVDRTTLLGNNREKEYAYWTKKMAKILKEHNLDYIDFPFFEDKNRQHPESAIGCYVNFLEVGDLILLPVFGKDDNMDAGVFKKFKKIYPDRIIETININEIGVHGGLLNCITWTIKE
jgi:agmatine deiminase